LRSNWAGGTVLSRVTSGVDEHRGVLSIGLANRSAVIVVAIAIILFPLMMVVIKHSAQVLPFRAGRVP
jgi:hypothetical protein